jgi:hypothetical protein
MRKGVILKHLIIISLILAALGLTALTGAYHGYRRGYKAGERATNTWWIDKKSVYYDTAEVIKRRIAKHHPEI